MPPSDATPTLYDVAREAGVSLATASRVLNGSTRRVGDELRERVSAAAARLGYSVHAPAQAFARGRTDSIVLVLSDIADPFFAAIAAGASRAADRAGLLMAISVTERDPARELDLVRLARRQRPRAIVLAGSRGIPDRTRSALVAELSAMRAAGTAVVTIGQDGLPFPGVRLDGKADGRALGRRLAGLGYLRPVVLGGPPGLRIARDRVAGLLAGFAEAGVAVGADAVVATGFARDDGETATAGLLRRDALAHADLLVAVNDVVAIGALAALRDAGVAVPDRLGVAGFDDVTPARDAAPPLTTMRLPLEEAGRRAVELALGGAPTVPLDGVIVLRASTRSR